MFTKFTKFRFTPTFNFPSEPVGKSLRRCALLSLPLLLSSSASAFAEAPAEVVYSKLPEGALRSAPGGSQIGSVRSSAPLRREEIRGDWVRVTVEGWVKLSDVDAKKSGVAAGHSSFAGEALTIADFSLENLSKNQTGDVERVRLKLTLKNTLDQPLSTWSGILVVQSLSGEVLVRTTITNGSEPIKARSTGEASYYWTPSEKEYTALSGARKESVRVTLLQVKIG